MQGAEADNRRATVPREPSDVLLRRYAARRDPADLERLTIAFRPLARRLAGRMGGTPDGREDLEQVADIGLVKALQRFDPSRGYAFSSFAVPTIVGELKRHLRDTAWSAHVPRGLQERVAEIRRATEELSAQTGQSPTIAAIAARTGRSEEEVLEALGAGDALSPVSLDGAPDEDGEPLGQRLGADDGGFEHVEDRLAIVDALPTLSPQQQAAIVLRFSSEMKQADIARQLGCSQMQISRQLRAGVHKLRHIVEHRSTVGAPG